MRKMLISIGIALFPVLFIIFTTPFRSLHEHIYHLIMFAVLGVSMAGFSAKNDLQKVALQQKNTFLPSFGILVFPVLLLFITLHLLPCPYANSIHSAQTVIDHPCCQPNTPCITTVSFVPVFTHSFPIETHIFLSYISSSISNGETRAPPTA